jgi:hypothetical protein
MTDEFKIPSRYVNRLRDKRARKDARVRVPTAWTTRFELAAEIRYRHGTRPQTGAWSPSGLCAPCLAHKPTLGWLARHPAARIRAHIRARHTPGTMSERLERVDVVQIGCNGQCQEQTRNPKRGEHAWICNKVKRGADKGRIRTRMLTRPSRISTNSGLSTVGVRPSIASTGRAGRAAAAPEASADANTAGSAVTDAPAER